jgi:hypothetical protein
MRNVCLILTLFYGLFAHAETNFKTEADLRHYVKHYLPTIKGWCSQEKATKFINLMLEIKPDVCVDIGTFEGSTVFPVACALKFLNHGTVVAIDAWDKLEAIKHFDPITATTHIEYWCKMNLNHIYYSYLNMIRMHELNDHCITLKTTSEKAGSVVANSIDFIYFDGNHSEAVSTKDVALYLPKVRSGGYICINDPMDPELQHAIDALMEKCEFIELFDNQRALLLRKK